MKERASDIHIEPFEQDIRVPLPHRRHALRAGRAAPKQLQPAIVSRIKILGGLNIAEKRLPQDGRIRLKIAGKDFDVRVSTVPIAYGERIVMRLLAAHVATMLDLERPRLRRAPARRSGRS